MKKAKETGVHMPSRTARDLMQSMKEWPAPLLEFPVYPEGKGRKLHVMVSIYKNKQQLRIVRSALFPEKEVEYVWGFTWASPDQDNPMIGRCCFFLSFCTDNQIAHEMLHAVSVWADRNGIPLKDRLQWQNAYHEEIAEAHGNMVSQFWKEFTKHYPRDECWQFNDGRNR